MNNWQPMDTAPKDGTQILIYTGDAIEPTIFLAGYDADTTYRGWYDDGGSHISMITHWMPLPAPPERGNPSV
jgi:hypothetical protein